ncbi:hypothetical protein GCM10009798_02890 [Nocardioides panacihumi]|uniref:ABC transporter permease n=1 Tax=Nocardioides panacihumi TaxID=400774 RepID=A0ABN2Q8V3_9ACTN
MPATSRAPLVVELGTGAPLISGSAAVGAALVLGGVFTSTDGQLPGWADPLNLVLTACLYLGPLAAGAAALQVSLQQASGILELAGTTPRGKASAIRLGWLAIASWQSLALLVLCALILVRSDLSGGFSPAMLLLPLQAALLVSACTAAGVAVARLWQHHLAAPAVAVALFAILYLTSDPADRLRVIYPEIHYQIYLEPNPGLLSSTALGLAFATVVAWTGLAVRRSRLRALGFVIAGALLASSVVTRIHTDERPVAVRRPPHSATCYRKHDVRLCTWPFPSRSLEQSLSRLDRMHRVLAMYDDAAPTDFFEVGLVSPERAAAYDMPRHDDLVQDGTEEAMALIPVPTCSRLAVTRAYGELVRWLVVESSRELGHSASAATSAGWVVQRLSAVRASCR